MKKLNNETTSSVFKRLAKKFLHHVAVSFQFIQLLYILFPVIAIMKNQNRYPERWRGRAAFAMVNKLFFSVDCIQWDDGKCILVHWHQRPKFTNIADNLKDRRIKSLRVERKVFDIRPQLNLQLEYFLWVWVTFKSWTWSWQYLLKMRNLERN